MEIMSRVTSSAFVLVLSSLFCLSCESHEPVPVSSCDQVVKHARKLMGEQADSWRKMEAQCKAASDQDRGCVMVADSAADLARCTM